MDASDWNPGGVDVASREAGRPPRSTSGRTAIAGARGGTCWALALLGLINSSCATQLSPVLPAQPAPAVGEAPRSDRCEVQDFPTAAEVPDGARSLGWVQVRRQPDDEATYVKLRAAVCARGGDAISGMAWIREASESEPSALRGSAWKLP